MIPCAQSTGTGSQIEARVAERLGPHRFNTWFKNATAFAVVGNHLKVSVPNHFLGDWIERNFCELIRESAKDALGVDFEVTFATDANLARGLAKKQPDRQLESITNQTDRVPRKKGKGPHSPSAQLALRGRLDQFVVGLSNRLAFAAATNVVEKPGEAYSPLFVHGGCGLGKTHLLQGICNGISERHPRLRWRYVSGEEFTNDFIYAVKAREEDAFRERYRQVDVLVLDDVHFLANKRATREEFLHTLKAIDGRNKQIVLASDAPPKMIGHLPETLVSRFLAGMVVRVDSPDLEVRVNVLRRRAEKLMVSIPETVTQYIAEHFRANIRELDGALLKVVAQADLAGQPVTLPLAERAIKDLIRQTAPVVMLSDIENIVSIYFGLTPADLHTSRKSRTIALAREIAMYLARRHTDMSFPEIGRYMGNKNHSTVILASRRVSQKLQANQTVSWLTSGGQKSGNLAEIIQEIEEQFGAGRSLAGAA